MYFKYLRNDFRRSQVILDVYHQTKDRVGQDRGIFYFDVQGGLRVQSGGCLLDLTASFFRRPRRLPSSCPCP